MRGGSEAPFYSNKLTGLPVSRVARKQNQLFKQVVSSAHGYVKPGEMVAIMGPSGSGKTSLLNCLTCRHNLSDSSYRIGYVTMNGQKLNQDSDFGLAGAFVQQDDILTEVFTVRELFEFACKIRLGFTGEKMN